MTLNLVDVAPASSGGDMEKFWKIFDERLDLCYRALMCRHNRLKGDPIRCGSHPVAVRRHRPVEKKGSPSTSCCITAIPPFPWVTPGCASACGI